MKRNAFTFWQAVLILVGIAILAAVFFPIFGRPRENSHSVPCQSNLKQIGLGFKQYVQDYDEKFPLVNSGKQGWMDILQPNLKSTQLFQCPKETSGVVAGPNDFFYNSRLSNVPEAKLSYSASTIISGDGIGAAPTNSSLARLPEEWRDDQSSPAWRHTAWGRNNQSKEGANYLYADGHVKWLRPAIVLDKKPAPNLSTFAPW